MLVRRNHLVPVTHAPFEHHLDRLFRDVLGSFPTTDEAPRGGQMPAVNVREDETSFRVEAELPGFAESDLNVTVLGDTLRLEGKREETHEENAKVYHRERWSGEFSRTLRFPVDIDDSKVDAHFKNGVLSITLGKAQAALPRKIQVQG
jgi:HSP20 family protein